MLNFAKDNIKKFVASWELQSDVTWSAVLFPCKPVTYQGIRIVG